jgi:hypothetical protein
VINDTLYAIDIWIWREATYPSTLTVGQPFSFFDILLETINWSLKRAFIGAVDGGIFDRLVSTSEYKFDKSVSN